MDGEHALFQDLPPDISALAQKRRRLWLWATFPSEVIVAGVPGDLWVCCTPKKHEAPQLAETCNSHWGTGRPRRLVDLRSRTFAPALDE
ncbi:hypothetical protein SUNI508_09042 [Seiridium unicorne]|uniref:Uncharacterized protein n=1 Tax=Seiridium unicorne TaxID=138068 RepID=A0ABR2URZ0_9PEZI